MNFEKFKHTVFPAKLMPITTATKGAREDEIHSDCSLSFTGMFEAVNSRAVCTRFLYSSSLGKTDCCGSTHMSSVSGPQYLVDEAILAPFVVLNVSIVHLNYRLVPMFVDEVENSVETVVSKLNKLVKGFAEITCHSMGEPHNYLILLKVTDSYSFVAWRKAQAEKWQ